MLFVRHASLRHRTDFWLKKLESNVIRHQQVKSDLERLGWLVITVWECELREPDLLAARLDADLISKLLK